jgi:hypothetical protein
MRISERTGSIPIFYPHFIIQTIIYTAKGGLDESSPYNKSNPNKIKRWIRTSRKWGLAPFYYKRFFLTGNSAGDRKRPIQKEGGFNERENN